MKKLLSIILIAALCTSCSRSLHTGSYRVTEAYKKDNGTTGKLKGVKGYFFFPTDTLKVNDRVTVTRITKNQLQDTAARHYLLTRVSK